MRREADIIKKILSDSGFEFCITEGSDILYKTQKYKDKDASAASIETVFGEGERALRVYINHTDDLLSDASMMLQSFLKSHIDLKQAKKLTLDDFFSDLLVVDIDRADLDIRELKIKQSSSWAAAYINYRKEPEEDIKEILKRSLPRKVMIAEHKTNKQSMFLLIEIPTGIVAEEMLGNIKNLYQILETEFSEKINIGISSIAGDIYEAKMLVGQAKKAAFFGKGQKGSDGVFSFDMLGLAKITAILEEKPKKILYDKVVRTSGLDLLDNELLKTIHVFFQNNLNASETARNLYVHRNTLAYRIEKIRKITGLNLNNFDDAAYLRFLLTLKHDEEQKGDY